MATVRDSSSVSDAPFLLEYDLPDRKLLLVCVDTLPTATTSVRSTSTRNQTSWRDNAGYSTMCLSLQHATSQYQYVKNTPNFIRVRSTNLNAIRACRGFHLHGHGWDNLSSSSQRSMTVTCRRPRPARARSCTGGGRRRGRNHNQPETFCRRYLRR